MLEWALETPGRSISGAVLEHTTEAAKMADDDGDFRQRAMAMYKVKGKKESRAAAASLKKDVTSTSGKVVEQEDYKALAMKLYKMEKHGDENDDEERPAIALPCSIC